MIVDSTGRRPRWDSPPLFQRLQLGRMGRDIGHIEPRENLLRGAGIVIGRAADQRETRQRHEGVDGRATVFHEEFFDRRPRIEPARKSGDNAEPARFESGDDAIVMHGIAGEHVGAQAEHADRTLRDAAWPGRQHLRPFGNPRLESRVIDADLGIMDRRGRLHHGAQALARSIRIALDEHADEIGDIVVRSRQPVLKGEEIGAHVLRGAGDEAQDLRQPLQHSHLLRAGARGFFLAAPQPFQEGQRPTLGSRHIEPADAGQTHYLGRRQQTDHCIAIVTTRLQVRQDRLEMILHEQHGVDDNVGLRDVRAATRQRLFIAGPFGRRMQDHRKAGKIAHQRAACTFGCACQMRVHRHDDDRHGCRSIVRNAPWHRTASPP